MEEKTPKRPVTSPPGRRIGEFERQTSQQKRKREKHERLKSSLNESLLRFRCLLTSVSGVNLKVPSSSSPPNPCFRFVFSNVKPFMTPILKKTDNPTFERFENEWIWETAASDKLHLKTFWVEYLSERSSGVTKKVTKIGETNLDLLSLCTGPTKYEMELFSVLDPEQSVGWIHFEFYMEEFQRRTALHLELTIDPPDVPLCEDLCAKIITIPMGTDDVKSRPFVKSSIFTGVHNASIPTIHFPNSSLKGLLEAKLQIIFLSKQKKNSNLPLVKAHATINIFSILPFQYKFVEFHTPLRGINMTPDNHFGLTLTASWVNVPIYMQVISGLRNSRNGITGEIIKGVIPPTLNGVPVQLNPVQIDHTPIVQTPRSNEETTDITSNSDNENEEDSFDETDLNISTGLMKPPPEKSQLSRKTSFFGNKRFSVAMPTATFTETPKCVTDKTTDSPPSTPSKPPLPTPQKRVDRILTTVGDYEILSEIGKGRFSVVYKAQYQQTQQICAIKETTLNPADLHLLPTIQREVDLLRQLDHPNIVKVLDCINTKRKVYVILENAQKGDLLRVMRQRGAPFEEEAVGGVARQVLAGLAYLHERNIIHRDLKAANLLLTEDNVIKLADFGTARVVDAQKSMTVIGTPYWMAPEIIELEVSGVAADVWSLGCTCVELVQGKPPYFDMPTMTALFRICEDEHPPLPLGVSPKMVDFLLRCFVKDPKLRATVQVLLKHPWVKE